MKTLRLLFSVHYWYIGLFCLPFALFSSWFLLICLLDRFGMQSQVPWLMPNSNWNTKIPLSGLLAIFLLDWLFLSMLRLYTKVYYDEDQQQLVLKGMGFFIPWKRTIPLRGVTSVVVARRRAGMYGSGAYYISLVREDNTHETLGKYTQLHAKRLAQDIATIIDKSMFFTE